MAEDLISIREACSLLQVSPVELEAMVTRGELSAVMGSTGEMSFRREDVVSLKRSRESEPTIIIPTGGPTLPGAPPPLDILIPDEPSFPSSPPLPPPGRGVSEEAGTALPTAFAPTRSPTGGLSAPTAPYAPVPSRPPAPPMPIPPAGAYPAPPRAFGAAGPGMPGPVSPTGLAMPAVPPPPPPARPAEAESGTEEIVIDDSDQLVLMPLDEEAGAQTSEITVIGTDAIPAGTAPADAVVFDQEMTGTATHVEVVEGIEPGAEATPLGPAFTAAGLKRVQAVREIERAEEVKRRSVPVYDLHLAAPVSTALMIVTSFILVFLGTVFAVWLWKGEYNDSLRMQPIPRFLKPFYAYYKDREYVYAPPPLPPEPTGSPAPAPGASAPPGTPVAPPGTPAATPR